MADHFLVVSGLTRQRIDRYFNLGGMNVVRKTSATRKKNGNMLYVNDYVQRIFTSTISQHVSTNSTTHEIRVHTNVRSQTHLNQTYIVEIVLKECDIKRIYGQAIIFLSSTKNIVSTHCECMDHHGQWTSDRTMKKCKHVFAMMLSLRKENDLNMRLKTANLLCYQKIIQNQENIKPHYKLGDCVFPLDELPTSFPGPADAFNYKSMKIKYALQWLTDDDKKKSNLAAVLVWMFVGNGCINKFAPKCPYYHVCNRKIMKFDTRNLKWVCRGYHHEKDIDDKIKRVQHNHTKPLFYGAPFFKFIDPGQIAEYTKFAILYFDGWSTIKTVCAQTKECYRVVRFWGEQTRRAIYDINTRMSFKLGESGSVLEMDATFYNKEWKWKKGPIPRGYHGRCWFRIVERDFTPKYRHRRKTFIVRSESGPNCIPLILRHTSALQRKVTIYADGCSFGSSKTVLDLSDHIYIDQCCHKDEMWVKWGTQHEDAHGSVSDQTTEASFQSDKLLHKSHYGLGCDIEQSQLWISESDWKNNFTNMSALDCIKTFIEQCSMTMPAKIAFFDV